MKIKKVWISFVIGYLIGLVILLNEDGYYDASYGDHFGLSILYGSIVCLPVLLVHIVIVSPILHYFDQNKGYLAREKKMLDDLLKIVAQMVQADGRTDKSELDLIRHALERDLKPKDVALYWELFQEYLANPQDIKEVCFRIDYEFDELAKTQFMFILIGIATADGLLSNTEIDLIKKIMAWANMPTKAFIQATRAYDFKRERSYEEQSRDQARRDRARQQRSASSRALKSAYALLDISEDASESMIKSAYRAMAKQHHPDRFVNRGPLQEEKAKEQFQLIADAYALIKERKGFK